MEHPLIYSAIDLAHAVTEARNERDAAKDKYWMPQVAALQSELAELRGDNELSRAAAMALGERVRELNQELAQLRGEKDKLVGALDHTQGLLWMAKGTIEGLTGALNKQLAEGLASRYHANEAALASTRKG